MTLEFPVACVIGLGILMIISIFDLLIRLFLKLRGTEIVVPHFEKRSPWQVENRDETSITLSTKFLFANEGKSSAMLIDVIARTQLPFEQYDAVEVRGRVECEKYPRQDDYFAAMIIEHQESLMVKALVTLKARKNFHIDEALAHMVDVPIDFIYETAGRNPCHYSKFRIVLTAEEITQVAGVTLLKD
ncbi:MAG: hypothetical protein IJ575_03995 [Selenomonadaceae bacterium]|nr:hypothetical protein [Selenomonadaceae bacterium]